MEVDPMQVTRRELLKGAAALGAAGALSHAVPGAAQAQTTQKKELVVAQGGDISKFDPHFSTSSNDIRWSFNIFDNLTSRHPDGKLYPGLATEWKLQGQTTWAFKLRPRQVQPRAHVRPERQDHGRDRLHDHRAHRGAGPCHPGVHHREARPAA